MTKMPIEGKVMAASERLPNLPTIHASVACIAAKVRFSNITGMASFSVVDSEGSTDLAIFLLIEGSFLCEDIRIH